MSRTSFLVAIALALALMQLFPNYAGVIKWVVVALGAVYLVVRALLTYPKLWREQRQRRTQQAADEQSFRQYQIDVESVTRRHAGHTAESGTALTPTLDADMAALHEQYQAMLDRKFPPPTRRVP